MATAKKNRAATKSVASKNTKARSTGSTTKNAKARSTGGAVKKRAAPAAAPKQTRSRKNSDE